MSETKSPPEFEEPQLPFVFIQDMVLGAWRAQVLFSMQELGIFKALGEREMTLQELATRCDVNTVALKILLTAAVAIGLLECRQENFVNSAAARMHLLPGHSGYMGDVLTHLACDIIPLWNRLSDAVREGSNRWRQVAGADASHFQSLYRNPSSLEAFLGTMEFYSSMAAADLAANFDFSCVQRLLDVGGATGSLSRVLSGYFPHVEVTVLDLPEVCSAVELWCKSNSVPRVGRMQEGDMLKGPFPIGYDTIHFGWVLHNWPEETQIALLQRAYEALPQGGLVLATECLLNEDGSGPTLPALLSVDMLVSADGGSESTASAYSRRFLQAGFDMKVLSLPGIRALLWATKKSNICGTE